MFSNYKKQIFSIASILMLGLTIVMFITYLNDRNSGSEDTFMSNGHYVEYDDVTPALLTFNNEKMLRWGIKRNGPGKTPDADPGTAQLFEKHNAVYIGDTTQKTIYLTFDEGYENGYTSSILDVLKRQKIQAVFFVTGPYLDKETELVRRMVEEGHQVGNHTVNHPSLPTIDANKVSSELMDLEKKFYEKYNKNMMFMRPPKGEYSDNVLTIADNMGYCTLFWSFAYDDWNVKVQRGKEYVVNKVMENSHNGEVILLHAVSKDNAEALEEIINRLRQAGYKFGSCEQLYKKGFRATDKKP